MLDNKALDKIARAWEDEYERWLERDARWLTGAFEVCRCDDSGCAGEFSEVHRFSTYRASELGLLRLRRRACARTVVLVMEKLNARGI
jgi:hypothetical protein